MGNLDCRVYNKMFSLVNSIANNKTYIQADANTMSSAKFAEEWLKYISILEL